MAVSINFQFGLRKIVLGFCAEYNFSRPAQNIMFSWPSWIHQESSTICCWSSDSKYFIIFSSQTTEYLTSKVGNTEHISVMKHSNFLYLSRMSKSQAYCSFLRHTGHRNNGWEKASAILPLSFIEHWKYSQCPRPNRWHSSWLNTCKTKQKPYSYV